MMKSNDDDGNFNHENGDGNDNTGFLGNGDGGLRDEEKSSSVKLSMS